VAESDSKGHVYDAVGGATVAHLTMLIMAQALKTMSGALTP
jgi:hypothetical protein